MLPKKQKKQQVTTSKQIIVEQVGFVTFTWITNENSVLNLLLTGTTARHFNITPHKI